MIERVKIYDSSQNTYTGVYTFFLKFEGNSYKVDINVDVLNDLGMDGLLGYLNLYFPNLGGSFDIIKLS
jgi:hypothetical protein